VTRLPFAPLERLIPVVDPEASRAVELADALSISVRQVFRYRHDGLSTRAADRLACHIGVCPENVWLQFLEVA
jgi:hypothetical protein